MNFDMRLSNSVKFLLTPELNLGNLPLSERELFDTIMF